MSPHPFSRDRRELRSKLGGGLIAALLREQRVAANVRDQEGLDFSGWLVLLAHPQKYGIGPGRKPEPSLWTLEKTVRVQPGRTGYESIAAARTKEATCRSSGSCSLSWWFWRFSASSAGDGGVAEGAGTALPEADQIIHDPQHDEPRDDLRIGDMWNSNSVISWLLLATGLPAEEIRPPDGGRAPGWRAGIEHFRKGSKRQGDPPPWPDRNN